MLDINMLDFENPTELCIIMGKNRSDKGNFNITKSHHNYTIIYHEIFKKIQNENLKIFELGLGTNNIKIPSNMGLGGRPGASLYGWAEYFKNSYIYGADVDKDILFQNDRIKTFYCDQTNPDVIKKLWNNDILNQIEFDIIIEDGLHEFYANVIFFENSIHKLKKNGYYIIEDIKKSDITKFEHKINEWKNIYPELIYQLICIPSKINNSDNNLLVIHKN